MLHLAASTLESQLEQALEELLGTGELFDYAAVKHKASPEPIAVPEVTLPAPDLTTYDRMIAGGAMTPAASDGPGQRLTRLMTHCHLTTMASELVPRLTDAGH